ncbi:PIR protein [Plasmodium ovale]|uniref:PIR protein n=1 Tax=Plasmodium ovale TaxID=36330 RepID=A0A1D3JF43_PLAOA|nr:PIR protein [Plasmodium ovale]
MTGSTLTKDKIYEAFHNLRHTFSDTEDTQYRDVLTTNDPVLRNISLYLIQHHKFVNVYCSSQEDCTLPCNVLNKWLNEKEAIYTSNGDCPLNRKLWNRYIENLWEKLGKTNEKPNWCKRKRDTYNGKYPKDWIPESCSNDKSIDVSISCSYDRDYKSLQDSPVVNSPCSGSSISQFYGYVLFVVLLSSILLYKFSPLGTWLDNRIENKNRIRENINSEAMEELPRASQYASSSSSSKFNVIYHSLEN